MKVREYLKQRGMVTTAGGNKFESPEILNAEVVKIQARIDHYQDIDLLTLASGNTVIAWTQPDGDIYGEDSDYPMTEALI